MRVIHVDSKGASRVAFGPRMPAAPALIVQTARLCTGVPTQLGAVSLSLFLLLPRSTETFLTESPNSGMDDGGTMTSQEDGGSVDGCRTATADVRRFILLYSHQPLLDVGPLSYSLPFIGNLQRRSASRRTNITFGSDTMQTTISRFVFWNRHLQRLLSSDKKVIRMFWLCQSSTNSAGIRWSSVISSQLNLLAPHEMNQD